METFASSFVSLGQENSIISKDEKITPVCVQQCTSTWVPSLMPQTPAKQRRTVHGPQKNDLLQAQLSNKQLYVHGDVKNLRKNVNIRKRPSTELSQFSALHLDDTQSTAPHVSQDGYVEQQPRRCGSRSMAPPSIFSNAVLLSSQPVSPKREWLPLFGRSFSHLPLSPEKMDISQADTEYSNFFGQRILTEYREIRELGFGSFGRVTLYEETSTGDMVAIKVSPPMANQEQKQRFMREKAILTLVRGFPHIVQLFEAWEEGRVPQMYLQMEYCKGGSVAEMAELRRKRNVAWEEREVFIFLAHMALALDSMHSANIAHMDFKPDNVLIDENGDYKLSDFGCSVLLNEDGRPRKCFLPSGHRNCNMPQVASTSHGNCNITGMTDTMTLSMPTQLSIVSVEEGDCRYLCSDMLNQKRYLREGDMFSFGISLFELMSGKPLPQQGVSFLELRDSPPVELLVRRGYSGPLVDLVAMLMHKDPTARPAARDVLRFFQLPPQTSMLVTHWATGGKVCGGAGDSYDGGEREASTLLEMRYVHAALEVASQLVYVTRRAFCGKLSGGSNNKVCGGGNDYNLCGNGEAQQQHTHADELCTPKTPVAIRRLAGD